MPIDLVTDRDHSHAWKSPQKWVTLYGELVGPFLSREEDQRLAPMAVPARSESSRAFTEVCGKAER
jgi:hypothetical protein